MNRDLFGVVVIVIVIVIVFFEFFRLVIFRFSFLGRCDCYFYCIGGGIGV